MIAALGILCLGGALGGYLAVGFVRGRKAGKVPLLHGAVGIGGLLALVLAEAARPGPPPRGLAGFGIGAEIVLAIALVFGLLVLFAAIRGRRPSGVLIGTHATLAIGGIVMVLALFANG